MKAWQQKFNPWSPCRGTRESTRQIVFSHTQGYHSLCMHTHVSKHFKIKEKISIRQTQLMDCSGMLDIMSTLDVGPKIYCTNIVICIMRGKLNWIKTLSFHLYIIHIYIIFCYMSMEQNFLNKNICYSSTSYYNYFSYALWKILGSYLSTMFEHLISDIQCSLLTQWPKSLQIAPFVSFFISMTKVQEILHQITSSIIFGLKPQAFWFHFVDCIESMKWRKYLCMWQTLMRIMDSKISVWFVLNDQINPKCC